MPVTNSTSAVGGMFGASKTLLSAVELDLFTVLGAGPMTGHEIGTELRLNARSVADFLDSLVSLGLLARDGDGAQAHYANTGDTAAFLDRGSPAYLGGILEMLNSRLYGFWRNLTEALRTGQPQNEAKADGGEFFGALYADEQRLEEFLRAMQASKPATSSRSSTGSTCRRRPPCATSAAPVAFCARSPHNGIRTSGRSPSTSHP